MVTSSKHDSGKKLCKSNDLNKKGTEGIKKGVTEIKVLFLELFWEMKETN